MLDASKYPYRPEIITGVDDLKGEACSALYAYWLDKKGDQPAPDWSDFEFMDLYKIASVMAVMDVDPSFDAGKLHYRFIGTKIVDYRWHREIPDLTGRTFAEADRSYNPAAMVEAYTKCMTTGAPVVMRGQYQTDQSYGEHERIVLPWLIDGTVARLTNALDRFPPMRDTLA
ncbi:MAG: PAS domain-containing protein [Rhodospirillales bacterium]|nr:PAS domain-containing protein [Rhodospirillales bacterium]MBO6788574.1 PAS domain-containing protein [Rhodospirillales bacterium]